MSSQNFVLIVFTSFLTATGNLMLRLSAARSDFAVGSVQQVVTTIRNLLSMPVFVIGTCCYVVATALWIYILSRQEIGVSYPLFVTCAFLFVTIGATFWLGESFTIAKLFGIILMLSGIACVALYR